MGLGRNVLGTGTGYPILLSFDGRPELAAGAITLAWETVTAVSVDTVTTEGYTVKNGSKWLRYGQVLTRLTTAASQILLVSGTPTGGSFVLTGTNPNTGLIASATIAYNAPVADVQAALEGIYGSGNVTVAGTGALPTYAHTITFGGILARVVPPPLVLAVNSLTGGSTPTATITPNVQVLTVTGTPTGGKTTLTVVNPITAVSSSVDVAYNATAATVQAALAAVLGAGNVVCTGGALPGTAITVGFVGSLSGYAVAAFTNSDAYTGGSSPACAVTATASPGGGAGKYGPYDPAATDGRQTLTQGECVLLNESIVQAGVGGILTTPIAINTTQIGGGLVGGRVWKDRIIATASTHSLAAGPTWAELFAAFPRIMPVSN